MKKIVSLFTFLLTAVATFAASPDGISESQNQQIRLAQRKFQLLVRDVKRESIITESNERFLELQSDAKERASLGKIGSMAWKACSSPLIEKGISIASNLGSLGANYLMDAVKGKRDKWYRTAQEQCHYHQVLSSESDIDDFYAAPSTKGAMDPENLKFEGFGCKNYIELIDEPGQGVNVFYIFCKMRRDSVGIKHIVNHSKFLIEVDTLMFIPRYCNLPNDPSRGTKNRFSFDKRDNLTMTLNVRLFSSWMNQATMITENKQLGAFTVRVKIDKSKVNDKGEFIYDRNDPDFEKLITIEGDSYIVPRSYTSTTDAQNYQPSWGTGQYRIEMELSEDCDIVDSYYQIPPTEKPEEQAVASSTKRKVEWDKAKWQEEWDMMQEGQQKESVWKSIWMCIVNVFDEYNWTATLTDPFTTSLYRDEATTLEDDLSGPSGKTTKEDTATAMAPAAVPSISTSILP